MPFSSTMASKFTYLHRRSPQNHQSHSHRHQKTLNFTKSDYTNNLLKHIVHKNHSFSPNQITQAIFSSTQTTKITQFYQAKSNKNHFSRTQYTKITHFSPNQTTQTTVSSIQTTEITQFYQHKHIRSKLKYPKTINHLISSLQITKTTSSEPQTTKFTEIRHYNSQNIEFYFIITKFKQTFTSTYHKTLFQ